MYHEHDNYIFFNGSTSKHLMHELSSLPTHAITSGQCQLATYNDGEIRIQINESVRDKCVFIIQSITSTETLSINDVLMELYLFIRALKRASAKKVLVCIPYFGYCRQDRKTMPRVPISASDVAMLLETAGADRIISIEMHCGQMQGFFRDISCDNLYSSSALADAFVENISTKEDFDINNLVIVSPDAGGVTRTKQFKETLTFKYGVQTDFAIIVKERNISGCINNMSLVGNVETKDVVIVDDICDTGTTLIKAMELLKQFGARHIYVCVTHGVFSKNAVDKLEDCEALTHLFVTNTIALKHGSNHLLKKITQVSIAKLLASTFEIFMNGGSISKLFVEST